MEKIVFDSEFDFAVKFKYEENPTWVNYEVVNVVAEYRDGVPLFFTYDTGEGAASGCNDFDEAFKKDPMAFGFIKWDGCMEIHDLNIHLCSCDNTLQRLVDLIYKEASIIMDREIK